ncbi:MAG: hypothetical protein WC506_02155 [Candidatus Micrarchaeia archaeon]
MIPMKIERISIRKYDDARVKNAEFKGKGREPINARIPEDISVFTDGCALNGPKAGAGMWIVKPRVRMTEEQINAWVKRSKAMSGKKPDNGRSEFNEPGYKPPAEQSFAMQGVMNSFDSDGNWGSGTEQAGTVKGKVSAKADNNTTADLSPNGFGDPGYFREETRMMM